MRFFGLLLTLLVGVLSVKAESAPVFRVEYSNPNIVPARWLLEFQRDGRGRFQSHRGSAVWSGEPVIEAPDLDREVQLSSQFVERVFDTVEKKHFFQRSCESHLRVAFQGTKKLSYSGPDGSGSCEFNYSKDQEIQALGDALIAVATTILEGARLQTLLLHDPLGLDREIDVLKDSAGDGRARQIGCIHDILQTLADDPAVMERVRRKARMLLAKASD